MQRLEPDERIVSIERLDRARCVLMDAHSLASLDTNAFVDPVFPSRLGPREFAAYLGGPWLAHIIQSLVLYETVLADSILFEVESTVTRAHELFPDAIRGIFIRSSARERVGERVDAAVARGLDSLPDTSETISEIWQRWRLLEASEKPLLDKISETRPRLIPLEYSSDEEVVRHLDIANPIWLGLSSTVLDSMMTTARAHFYLELARELVVPLNIDPVRATYLASLLAKSQEALGMGVPERVVDDFASRIKPPVDAIVSFDLPIPPVPEYVLRLAKAQRISLYEATMEVRNSTNARNFRDLCATLFNLGEEGGLHAQDEYNTVMKDFATFCEAWARDASEGVDYRIRTLQLGDIPIIGWILKVAGMDERMVRDPVITPDTNYRYFLFLNDLLRSPRQMAV
jgi:hypothetical protein